MWFLYGVAFFGLIILLKYFFTENALSLVRSELETYFNELKILIMATEQEFIERINTLTGQVGKVREEVQALKDAIEAEDEVPQGILDAFANLESAVQGVDDINPDEEPPVEESPEPEA